MGCVMQVGEQGINIARNAVLAAGWPETVPGTTIDRQCGSSQQAAHFAAQGVIAGAYDVVVAAGVEVMTRVPMGASMADGKFGYPFGPKVGARYAEQGGLVPQGISAELIADKWDISRDDMDAFGARSQQLAATATAEGRFEREILPVLGADGADDDHRRGAARDDGRVARPSSSRRSAPRRRAAGSRPATRRRSPTARGGADHERGEGRRPRADAAGPVRRLRPRRRRPAADADRADPGHAQGARAGQADDRRHRPGRDQRGVRLGRAGVGEGAPPGHGPGQRQRRARSPSATRSAARAPG